jgi:prepilin-type N-terminal cleavage/methylation domain-containing protein
MMHRCLDTAVPSAPTFRRRGFTLTEMAVVLVIVALLIGGMVLPLAAQQDIRNATETQKLLADVAEALYGFAVSHAANDGRPYLPCPDTDGDGLENRSGATCVSPEGTLPWATLGIGRQDAWGNSLRYRVAANYSSAATGFALIPGGTNNLRVCTSSACTAELATALPAVILSLGKNGAITPAGADEQENVDGDDDFVQLAQASASYDDIVIWLSANVLLNRMVATGRLP